MYVVRYSPKAEKELNKLDDHTYELITSWMEKNVNGSNNPRQYGKALKGNLKGYWRYRVLDYRILCKIEDNECIVLVIHVAHMREVYE